MLVIRTDSSLNLEISGAFVELFGADTSNVISWKLVLYLNIGYAMHSGLPDRHKFGI